MVGDLTQKVNGRPIWNGVYNEHYMCVIYIQCGTETWGKKSPSSNTRDIIYKTQNNTPLHSIQIERNPNNNIVESVIRVMCVFKISNSADNNDIFANKKSINFFNTNYIWIHNKAFTCIPLCFLNRNVHAHTHVLTYALSRLVV